MLIKDFFLKFYHKSDDKTQHFVSNIAFSSSLRDYKHWILDNIECLCFNTGYTNIFEFQLPTSELPHLYHPFIFFIHPTHLTSPSSIPSSIIAQ